jgi:PqqD family protein of HPr-rel-A system
MTIVNGSRITPSHDVQLTRTGDEAVLVDAKNGKVHVVNRTAARVWEHCGEEPTVERLLEAMSREYEVTSDQLRPDIESLLETFRDLQLIVLTPSS